MSKRIESVIDNCVDCRYSKEYQELSGNSSFVLLCNHALETNDENYSEIKSRPKSGMFLLHESSNQIKKHGSAIEIPKECPLETYTTKNNMHFNEK